jgi:hypothetical protein
MRQSRLMRQFREAKATDPKSAKTLAEIGCRNSWIFRRMAAKGVFIESDDGRFYMDEDAARWFVKRRRWLMLTFLAVVVLLFVIWQTCS